MTKKIHGENLNLTSQGKPAKVKSIKPKIDLSNYQEGVFNPPNEFNVVVDYAKLGDFLRPILDAGASVRESGKSDGFGMHLTITPAVKINQKEN